jgi:hypothetical protein
MAFDTRELGSICRCSARRNLCALLHLGLIAESGASLAHLSGVGFRPPRRGCASSQNATGPTAELKVYVNSRGISTRYGNGNFLRVLGTILTVAFEASPATSTAPAVRSFKWSRTPSTLTNALDDPKASWVSQVVKWLPHTLLWPALPSAKTWARNSCPLPLCRTRVIHR